MGCEFTPLTSLYKNNTSDITAIPAGISSMHFLCGLFKPNTKNKVN